MQLNARRDSGRTKRLEVLIPWRTDAAATSGPVYVIHVEQGHVNLHSSKAVSMAKPSSITIPTESIGSIPRPVDMIERPRKATVRMPTSLLSMKMRFEIPLA